MEIFKYVRDDIVKEYIEIEDDKKAIIVAIFLIILVALLIIFTIKTIIDVRKLKKENRETARRIDKKYLEFLKLKNKK